MSTSTNTVPARGAAWGAEPPAPPELATVPDWRALSGMSNTGTYKALSRGDLKAVKLGARTLIDVRHGLAWLRGLPPATVNVQGSKPASEAA